MQKKLQKNDYFFIVVILAGLLLHIVCIYSFPLEDETFYPSVPLRLINGDSLVQHEWHLSQFSSLFLYLPVRIWLTLKGSADGIVIYLRVLSLVLHTFSAACIYKFFRKYGVWAVVAVALFYTQAPYRLLAISYVSMYALFLILFTFFIFLIYKKERVSSFVCAGICFGACCVCNPFCCILFFIYAAACFIWTKKEFIHISGINKGNKLSKKGNDNNIVPGKKAVNKSSQQPAFINTFNCFFTKKAFLFFSCGIGLVAAVSIFYFFSTGATLSSVINNIGNLLESSEYGIVNSSFFNKLTETLTVFNKLSFNMPFLLPGLFAALCFDKKRKELSHKTVYLVFSFAIAILYIIRILTILEKDIRVLAFLLPVTIVSLVCYILTENKNKPMFYCMWIPGAVGAIVQFFAAKTFFASIGWSIIVCAVTGVFFIGDFVKELNNNMHIHSKSKISRDKKYKKLINVCNMVICVCFGVQLLFQCFVYQYGRFPDFNKYIQLTSGPCAGTYVSADVYKEYSKGIEDLDVIKMRSESDDPVLIISNSPWMYLYIERPFAAYTTWHENIDFDMLNQYYELNPDKTPKYIYVSNTANNALQKASMLKRMFDCTRDVLSDGTLLTVKE